MFALGDVPRPVCDQAVAPHVNPRKMWAVSLLSQRVPSLTGRTTGRFKNGYPGMSFANTPRARCQRTGCQRTRRNFCWRRACRTKLPPFLSFTTQTLEWLRQPGRAPSSWPTISATVTHHATDPHQRDCGGGPATSPRVSYLAASRLPTRPTLHAASINFSSFRTSGAAEAGSSVTRHRARASRRRRYTSASFSTSSRPRPALRPIRKIDA